VRATSDRAPSSYFAMAEVLLCLVLFVATALHVRLRFKHAALLSASESAPASPNTP
jgi:uncharacterized membrane protein